MYKIISTNSAGDTCSFMLNVKNTAPNLVIEDDYLEEIKVSEVSMSNETELQYKVLTTEGVEVEIPTIGSFTNPISSVVYDLLLINNNLVMIPSNKAILEFTDNLTKPIIGINLGGVVEYSEKSINGYVTCNSGDKGLLEVSADFDTVKGTATHKIGLYLLSGVKYGGLIPPRVAKVNGELSIYDKSTPVSILIKIDRKVLNKPLMYTAAVYNDGSNNRITGVKRTIINKDPIFAINP